VYVILAKWKRSWKCPELHCKLPYKLGNSVQLHPLGCSHFSCPCFFIFPKLKILIGKGLKTVEDQLVLLIFSYM
jgi:hypothetical protein